MTAPVVAGLDLVELLGRLAPRWLRRLEVTGGRVVVELEERGRVLGLSRVIAEGEHDVAALVAELLADAAELLEVERGLVARRAAAAAELDAG